MMPVWKVALLNFGYSKSFESYDEAMVWAKRSTFEVAVYSPDGTLVASGSYLQGYRERAVLA